MELKGKWKVVMVAGKDENGNIIWIDEEQHKAMPGFDPAAANPYNQYYLFEDNTKAYPLMPIPPNVKQEEIDKMVGMGLAKVEDGMLVGITNPISLKEEDGKMFCSLKVFGDPNAPWEEMIYEDGLLQFLVIYKLEKTDQI